MRITIRLTSKRVEALFDRVSDHMAGPRVSVPYASGVQRTLDEKNSVADGRVASIYKGTDTGHGSYVSNSV